MIILMNDNAPDQLGQSDARGTVILQILQIVHITILQILHSIILPIVHNTILQILQIVHITMMFNVSNIVK